MESPVSNVRVKYQTLVSLWGALLASQIIFLVIVYSIKPDLFTLDFTQPFLGKHPIVIVLFAAVAIAVFVLSFLLRNQHMRRAIRDQDTSCVQTGLLLGCALSEISSILGLVLAFVFDYQYFFAWIALGLVGVLLHFPRRTNLLAAERNV
jgi:Na+-translocating ferredoxin:NAD+ oxidoreductase RnfD subunit